MLCGNYILSNRSEWTFYFLSSVQFNFTIGDNIPIVPRDNSTGLMGANLTVEGGISLDMIKMNKLLEYDPTSLTMTVQAGMRLIDIEKFLANKPFSYMPAPAMHWASIGGNVDTDAGGLKSVRYSKK